MLRRQYMVVVLVFAAVPCICPGYTRAATPAVTPESYAVYSAVLPRVWESHGGRARRYLINDRTSSVRLKQYPSREQEQKMLGAMQAYELANIHEWKLQRHFALDLPYDLIDTNALKAETQPALQQHEKRHFDSLYRRAHGIITLSAVGFNADQTVAIVQTQLNCGPLCGEVRMYAFEKVDAHWAPLLWGGVEVRREY